MKKAGVLCIILLVAFYPKLVSATTAEAVKPAVYSGSGLPEIHQMTRLFSNVRTQAKPACLRIIADYFCYSDSRFYAAIQTQSGNCPISGKLGTSWYSYMTVIGKPGDDKIVWALTYINVPMSGLKPGLYKVDNRKKQVLVRIGDIEYKIDKDKSLLRMSCKISDLLADPDFSAWYNKKAPRFGLLSITNSTTIIPFKTKTVGTTYPGRLISLGK